jgi:1,4-alpha-glucan branching enzyme
MNSSEINALVNGDFDDAFSILGMHELEKGNGLAVRAFLPGAESVEVIDSDSEQVAGQLKRLHDSGLFEAQLESRSQPFRYRYRVQYPEAILDVEDPYRFPSLLSKDDLYLFGEGTQERLYHWMGAHVREVDGVSGMMYVVWAPTAKRVSVIGDFNHWDGRRHVMRKHPASGVWDIFIPGLGGDMLYKFEIRAANGTLLPLKADPYGFATAHSQETSSKTVHSRPYPWTDESWMSSRASSDPYHGALSIYEVHAGSWRRKPEEGNRFLSYRELADELIPYVIDMGFTHIQFMPLSEYPFGGSWGYQPIGMFAPTSRFGTPDDFRYFVDECHNRGIGVLLDWVPGHFPTDQHGLGRFDGTALYEHDDLRLGYHPDWNTLIYNYSRREVISYLLSNAMYWLDEFHVDGLRVDAVASMLYLDYSRKEGEWIPNKHGGRENLDAIELLKQINSRVYFNYPGVLMIAEESTSWPGVSKPVTEGGLGFGFKWNMGWMNDSLQYIERDPVHRKHHHNELTFSLVYAFSENFILPLSHDEVVHGKGSLINKMPGDEWQKFANLRAYLAFMWTHPGKKLLFMGGEFGQRNEWNHDLGLDWHLLHDPKHIGLQDLVRDLNRVYREIPALHQMDHEGQGFEWMDSNNWEHSILSFLRRGEAGSQPALVVVNLTPVPHSDYRVVMPEAGYYRECLNTDSERYGGSNMGNVGGVQTREDADRKAEHYLNITLPPLAALVFEKSS